MQAIRPRLLFLCQNLPFPPDGGVQIRSWHTLRLLAREFDVTALCFYRAATRGSERAVAEGLRGMREVATAAEAFPIPHEHARARLLADHLRSVLSGRAYTVFTYESRAFRRRLEEVLGERRFDLVHVDSLDLAAYLPALAPLPVVCAHHNVESALLRRRAAHEGPARRAYLRLQAGRTEREERRWCPRVALNVAVSDDDAAELKRIAPGSRVAVMPNGVDTATLVPGTGRQEGIVFVGGATWRPNEDGMRWFCRDVLPRLRARGVDAPVRWIGRASAAQRDEFRQRYGVEATGFVADVRPYVQGAACFVAPLRFGGGTRLKILDAWAMGKAVVSTSQGCEGLDARDGENLLVRDDAEAFADAVCDVLTDAGLAHRLGERARRTVVERYDWEVVGRPMLDEYRRLLKGAQEMSPC